VAQLDPSLDPATYQNVSFDFGIWIANFDTIHVLSATQVIFTGYTRVNSTVRTVVLSTDGTETELTDTLAGFRVGQQIEITPPPDDTYTLPEPVAEATDDTTDETAP